MQKPILPKGTRDFNSEELYKRNYIINIIKDNFLRFGFNPIETPSFERSETLLGKSGQEGERLIFKILKSGDFLKDTNVDEIKELKYSDLSPKIVDKALRYDLTVLLLGMWFKTKIILLFRLKGIKFKMFGEQIGHKKEDLESFYSVMLMLSVLNH